MAIITIPGMFLTGDHASRPAASAVGGGSVYSCTDHALIYQSDGSTWSTWFSGGGAPLTRVEYTLSADVTLTTATTFYDGPSGTPAAGTYDVTAFANFVTNQANEDGFCARLVSGSTVIDERTTGYIGPNSSGGPASGGCALSARVTMNGSDTLKLTASSFDRNGSLMIRDPLALSSGLHRATMIVTVRIS
jgi:hypothetical protein